MYEGRGHEGECRRDMTPKERVQERRPGAWETISSRESGKLESVLPPCRAGEMPGLHHLWVPSQTPCRYLDQHGKKAGDGRAEQCEDAQFLQRQRCPLAMPVPSSPRDQPTCQEWSESWTSTGRLRFAL